MTKSLFLPHVAVEKNSRQVSFCIIRLYEFIQHISECNRGQREHCSCASGRLSGQATMLIYE